MTITTPTTASSVTVNAYGSASEQTYPHMQVLMNGILLGEWDVTGSSQNYTANVSGRKLYYYHGDQLGSTRLLTDANGSVVWQGTYQPYGYEVNPQGSVNNKFTGFEHDAESQLDHAFLRQYSARLGRWMSPDPAGLAAVDPTNPQTWNRYAYVGGNPMNAVDPRGLEANDFCSAEFGGAACGYSSWGGGIARYNREYGGLPAEIAEAMQRHDQMVAESIRDERMRRTAEKAGNEFLRILETDNDCSSYFNSAAESFSGGFDSESGPLFSQISVLVKSNSDPRVGATTQQGAGIGGTIALNPIGPFYRALGVVNGKVETLRIGPFMGTTLQAQLTIYAHEFAHLINGIPSDAGDARKSMSNTETVLGHCNAAIRASGK